MRSGQAAESRGMSAVGLTGTFRGMWATAHGAAGAGTRSRPGAGRAETDRSDLRVNADPSLADLAQAAARGDRPAFDHLHRRFAGGLRRLFLTRTAGRDDLAEDLSQRTWLACWRAAVVRSILHR